jgi:uncharacterized protein (TIGR01777 family)
MNVLIAGGSGFLGTALKTSLRENGYQVYILSRRPSAGAQQLQWDGKTTTGWGDMINDMEIVVNLTGYGLEHWPWTKRRKQEFMDSRVLPGRALVAAIQEARRRPRVFLQASGINRYGLRGTETADESTPPGDDFLARLTVPWEDSTLPVEQLGVRRVIARSAVVLSSRGGMFPLMTLPTRLFFGGKFGDGQQAVPWIHLVDHIRALRFLLENENAQGPFNLIAPQPTSGAEFMHTMARMLRRPYWFHVPRSLLRLVLGEMSVLLTEGRYARPKRLIELGFQFQFGQLESALYDLLATNVPPTSST